MSVKRGNVMRPNVAAALAAKSRMSMQKEYAVIPLEPDAAGKFAGVTLFKDRFQAEMYRARLGDGWVVHEMNSFGFDDE